MDGCKDLWDEPTKVETTAFDKTTAVSFINIVYLKLGDG